jgi:serine protease
MRAKIMLVMGLAALACVADASALNCNPPAIGDWIVAQSCTFQGQATAPANVIVQAGVTLTVAPGADLNIDFTGHHLRVRQGAKVIVKLGAKIR